MQESFNFSSCSTDLNKFDSQWDKLENFLTSYGLSGVELFVDQNTPADIPNNLVTGVHLPYWMGQHRCWLDPTVFNQKMDDFERQVLYGGHCKSDIIGNFNKSLKNATKLEAAYGVFHVAYSEPNYIFENNFQCTNIDVFKTTANFLNESMKTFDNGEPPVRIFFENLWWPGLTLLDNDAVYKFIDMLEFDNWAFLLDTGHLIAAIGNCITEDTAIDAVLDKLSTLDQEIIDKIEGMHFHCGTSGGYKCVDPQKYKKDNSSMFFDAMEYVNVIDPHLPFTSRKCREIVNFISPQFLTHEFISLDIEDLTWKIQTQLNALYG